MSKAGYSLVSPFRILAVCTGNICRSPLMAALLQARAGEDGCVEVASAGTSALTGRPVHPAVVAELGAARLAAPRAVARQLTASMVDAADLVLTAERAHRSAVVRLQPRAVRRTFTLLEFADLVEIASTDRALATPVQPPAVRLAKLVDEAPSHRAERVSRDDDIADPFGSDQIAFQVAAERIATAVNIIFPDASGEDR